MKEIIELIKATQQEIKKNIPHLNEEIDYIINNKEKSIKNIEKLLDILLNCAYIGCGTDEFKRLNKYYSTINKENSEKYTEFYNEIMEE